MSRAKKQLSLAAGLLIASLMVLSWPVSSCANYSQPLAPSGPVATPTPYPVSLYSNAFAPSALSVESGKVVIFDLGSGTHTLQIDDGAGTCGAVISSFPYSYTFSGPSGTVFHLHCTIHGSCSAGCQGCSGMAMNITIL